MYANPIEFLELFNGQVQYVVPRWQRRYSWAKPDIERLVEDLLTVADAGPGATHYGGTLLTFQEPGAPGVVRTIRVVDGQQRLTTVSILLACIAERLERDGPCGDWTAEIIREDRLINPKKPEEKHRKLRLQDGDEEEYRFGLEGNLAGEGAVSQAWKTARDLVNGKDTTKLLAGLERLQVVSIGLTGNDDPQQIFESLNATGRSLTESEKVKNWLLMGLPDEEQQELHDKHWKRIEQSLGAERATDPVDVFLRDFLRWKTGEIQGIRHIYEALRRWAVRQGFDRDRPALCRELERLAALYGVVTGTVGNHPDAHVERELRHLRAMELDIHRPLTLRLLDDEAAPDDPRTSPRDLAKTLAGIGSWITRLWLRDKGLAGMNRAITTLAHGPGPQASEDVSTHWLRQIRRHRNQQIGVPADDEVREGLRTRKAYGGKITQTTFAILCALMEAEHGEEAPARDRLTVEHVMPQTLTEDWKHALGADAEKIHEQYCDRLANLTLSGYAKNSSMGAGAFDAKRSMYRSSPIGITRRLADEEEWGAQALERRADDLARRALERWPWRDDADAARHP